jgi:hypothetical protein
MQNKSNKWLDVQIVLITLFMTISLFLWNLFAGGSRTTSTATTTSASANPLPDSSVQTLPSGVRILLGGPAPQQLSTTRIQTQVQAQSKAPAKAPSKVPAPVTVTRSSRP